jgi:N-acyl-D-aspartate/D-glutamate deacylase
MTHGADLDGASRFVIRDVAIFDGTGRDPVGRSDVEVGPDGIRKIARSGSIRTRARSTGLAAR